MLPRTSRLRIGGLEDAAAAGADRGGRESSDARQRRRYASMWDGARNLLGEIMAQPEAQPAQQLPHPSPRNHFTADSCLRLLEVLPESARNAKRLRASAMRRLTQMMDDDQRPTVRRRRRAASSSSLSESEAVSSSASDESSSASEN